jgi:hypothetical protein
MGDAMNATTFAKSQLEQSLGLLKTAADGMTDEEYNFDPAGTCNAAAKSHVHALASLDFFILASAKGEGMQWPATAAAAGLPANPMEIFGFAGKIPSATIKDYGQRVQTAVLEYIGSLSDADLDRVIETPFGKQSLAWTIQLMTVHASGHAGDIAAVKGMQGLKGLPF